MKKFFLIIFFLFFIVKISTGAFAAVKIVPKDEYFSKYNEDVTNYCESTSTVSPWFSNMQYFLSEKKPVYTYFMDENADNKYDSYLQKIAVQGLGNTLNLATSGPFEKAQLLYIETQNAIFNCAILKTKLKIGKAVITYISKNEGDSNTIKKISDQNDMINKELSNKKCTTVGDQDTNAGYKVKLLNNVIYQYCLYKYYLNYLNSFLNNNIKEYGEKKKTTQDNFFKNWQVQDLSNYLTQQKDILLNEDTHARNVYEQALVAYEEFENTYGSHIMLMLIYDDYIKVRNNIKNFLNPISQLIYKIPQAQKQ